METVCEDCNKKYKTYAGLWKHKRKVHNIYEIIPEKMDPSKINSENPTKVMENSSNNSVNSHLQISNHKIDDKIIPEKMDPSKVNSENPTKVSVKYQCSNCSLIFKHYQSRWKHEKKCNQNDILQLKEQMKNLTEKVKEIDNKPKIVNNYTTNNTLNKKQILITCQPGSESIDHLTISQQRAIMEKGLQSLLYLIKTTNFAKDIPENHSYCVTALNDKHASMIDVTTNSIIKTDKNELFDRILIGNIKKLEKISDNKQFTHNEREVYKLKLESLKDLLFKNKRGLKKYYNELNLLSYNNKDLIIDTWASLKTLDDIIEDNQDILEYNLSESEELDNTNDKTNKSRFKGDHIINYYSSDEDSDDNDSDTDSDNEPILIQIKKTQYILEGTRLYTIKNGVKGKYYGVYENGKAKKEIDI